MHSNALSLFFILLNNFVLAALVFYLYKKKLKPTIVASMDEQEEALHLLTHEKDRLGQEQIALNVAAQEQEQFYDAFVRRMDAWRAHDQQQERARHDEQARIAHQLEKQLIVRKQYRVMQRTIKKILPASLDEARAMLEKEYAHTSRGEQFVENLVSRMKEQR